MTKILCFNANEERIPFIEEWAATHKIKVDYVSEFLTLETVHMLEGYDGVTVAHVGDFDSNLYPILKEMGIKQVAQRTAGYEIFDLEEASKNDIIITNVPSYSPESIAEYSLMLGLQLVRKSHQLDKKVAVRDFSWTQDIRARVIKDMTVAVIGVGHIGLLVAKLYKAFGANVIGYDPYPKAGLEDIITFCDSVEDAVKQADLVSLHMPAFKDNYHLFNDEMFKLMKNDAYLVNCARGTLVDTSSLLNALDAKEIAGAALDVYENEAPYVPGNHEGKEIEDSLFKELLEHPKVTFYHHCAYYTDVSVRNMTQFALDATLEILQTNDTNYRVN
ncbi:D-2-hydroxyacid dehydrogenase [Erysipelothrix urinaevulpis]|uniref:D-2-hydroxyacid dehydrogenase n=1 Tax=Erysipelothrix urinaevulpis TaxID=2683717 RepID=UPI0013597E16|nr:D-2-hydroxyacid dehydrogenase [Erysipelothrix urinaevulpis]